MDNDSTEIKHLHGRPKLLNSPNNQIASSWPRLPQIALTTHDNVLEPLSSKDSQQEYPENENVNITELLTPYNEKNDQESYFDDVESIESKQPSLESTTSLVEAALDKAEAKDRHVRFHDHVAESAALVQRMISVKRGNHFPNEEIPSIKKRYESDILLEENNSDDNISSPIVGGSVLASLMKLEATHQHSKKEKKKTQYKSKKDRKASTLQRKKKRPTSLVNFPIKEKNTDPSTPKLQRPHLVNRPVSWLSEVTSSKYLVPNLEKKKKQGAPSFYSRRTSIDSMVTTASQFEPITLEERLRITFEIANILQKQEFLRKLCKSLMLYGCPAHRLEQAMRHVSRTLGVEAEYVYLPNVMLITFIDSSMHTTETHFIRENSTFEMHRLADIYRLEKLVAHGEVSVDEALEFIDKVYTQPPLFPIYLHLFIYALLAFAGCVLFFGGRWKEAGVSASLGMIFAMNEIFSKTISSFQPIWEITVCILIGFVARGIQKYGFCFTPIAFSSFIIVLPGYPMAVAIIELVSRQLVNGVVRMVYAIIYSFLLGYGVSMGSELYLAIDKTSSASQTEICKQASNAATCISSESQWFNFLLVPLFCLGFCIFLRARVPRWPMMMVVAAITYVINYSLACWAQAPSQILQVAPSFVLGLLGNLLSKLTGRMSFDAMLLGVFFLVPSSLGLKAALGLFSGTEEFGTQGAGFALAMIESSIGITLGLCLATLIVYPKGTKNTPLMTL